MSQLKVDTITDEAGTGSPSLPNGLTVGGVNYPSTGPLSNRNKIINGAMVIDQRNAGAAVTAPGFPVDRFFMSFAQSTLSGQRSTTAPTGFSQSLQFTNGTGVTPAASDFNGFSQGIEGFNIADLSQGTAGALSFTVSFWVRSSVTGTYAARLTSASALSYVFTYTISQADTWEHKAVTISGDTTGSWSVGNSLGMQLLFDLGSGSNFNGTAGAWNSGNFTRTSGSATWRATTGATFYITGVQLEAGTVATPFEHRSFGQELALCQRYFAKTYQQDTVPGATGTTGVGAFFTPNPVTNSYPILGTWNFPSTMRATPTIVLYNPSTGAVGGFLGDSTNFSSASVGSAGQRGASFFGSNVSVGTSVFMSVQATASAEL
jgi:hypothetical protein